MSAPERVHIGNAELWLGDCREVLPLIETVAAVVTDPPYGLSFMGKRWDSGVPESGLWALILERLSPGGHLLAFAGTRTQHRMAVAIEDAGFEIRDMIAWVYGCLDEATEVATEKGVMPYHKTKIGDRVLCYDVEHGEYTYQPILEIVEYDYSDTAFRLVGDFGEQVVSRNHRVIVERGGSEAFQLAETLECEARVPVLESLPALRKALHDAHQGAGRPQQDVQCDLCECVDRRSECCDDAIGTTQGCDDQVRSLRGECMEAECVVAQGGDPDMQQAVQRCASRRGVGHARAQRAGELVCRVGGGVEGAHDRRIEPGVEGRVDVPQAEGRVCGSADQVRALPCAAAGDGAVGRLCDGAPHRGGASDWSAADADGVRSPHQPRCDGQPSGEPDVVCDERAAQGVRAWGGHRSAVVRVVPFHYTGKVWCLRVPTGAFVAVRNGVAFPTGNSGFPKSLDVSKAIDKAAGVEFEAVPEAGVGFMNAEGAGGYNVTKNQLVRNGESTEAARQWQGWGTALKPSFEPLTLARKPLAGTVAHCVQKHGTGAVNIKACRIPGGKPDTVRGAGGANGRYGPIAAQGKIIDDGLGRWPANLIHDGSDGVVALFPNSNGQSGSVRGTEPSKTGDANCYGDLGRIPFAARGDFGSASRFFYCAKATAAERGADNNHPTVKPLALMRYLLTLVTPPGGVVLDPFLGSGSTGVAAALLGVRFVGIEREREYFDIACRRIDDAQRQGLLI